MQRNALCSVNSQTFRGARTSVARVRWTANRYSASSRDGALCKRDRGWGGRFCGLRGRFCACALPIQKEGPLGTISVRFNTRILAFISGKDVFVSLPTGYGKYFLPLPEMPHRAVDIHMFALYKPL